MYNIKINYDLQKRYIVALFFLLYFVEKIYLFYLRYFFY